MCIYHHTNKIEEKEIKIIITEKIAGLGYFKVIVNSFM